MIYKVKEGDVFKATMDLKLEVSDPIDFVSKKSAVKKLLPGEYRTYKSGASAKVIKIDDTEIVLEMPDGFIFEIHRAYLIIGPNWRKVES